mgnify:CR=1 FL=1
MLRAHDTNKGASPHHPPRFSAPSISPFRIQPTCLSVSSISLFRTVYLAFSRHPSRLFPRSIAFSHHPSHLLVVHAATVNRPEITVCLYIGPSPSSLGRMDVRNRGNEDFLIYTLLRLYYTTVAFTLSSFEKRQTSIITHAIFIRKTRHIYTNTKIIVKGCLERKRAILATTLITSIRSLAITSKLLLRPKAGWAGILTSRHAVSNIPSDSLSSPHRLYPTSFPSLEDNGRPLELSPSVRVVFDECHTIQDSQADFRPDIKKTSAAMVRRGVQMMYLNFRHVIKLWLPHLNAKTTDQAEVQPCYTHPIISGRTQFFIQRRRWSLN